MNMDSSRILAIINDQTLGLSTPPSAAAKSTRIGARAILFDGNSRAVMLSQVKILNRLFAAKSKKKSAQILQTFVILVLFIRTYRHTTKIATSIISLPVLMVRQARVLGLTRRNCTVARLFGATISSKLSSEFNPVHPRNMYTCLSERESWLG